MLEDLGMDGNRRKFRTLNITECLNPRRKKKKKREIPGSKRIESLIFFKYVEFKFKENKQRLDSMLIYYC